MQELGSLACDNLNSRVTALTWFHEWARGVLLGNALRPAGERGGGKLSRDAQLVTLLLLRPRDYGNRSFIEDLGTAGFWASGTQNFNERAVSLGFWASGGIKK